MQRRIRKAAVIIMLFVLWMTSAFPVCAHAVPDMERSGSLTMNMEFDGKTVTGGTFSIYRVGQISEDNGDYSFEKTGDFASFTGDLAKTEDAALAERLYRFIQNKGIAPAQTLENKNGRVVFENLTLGLYLVTQKEATKGYQAISPFLVSIPLYEDGNYVYHVNAYGKFAWEKAPDTEKPQEQKPAKPQKPSGGTGSRLPQTGQMNWPIPLLAVSGMVLFVFGWKLQRRKGQYASK